MNGVYRTSGFWLRNAPSRLRHSSRLRGAGEDAHRNHPLSAPPTTAEAPPQFPAASTGGYVTRQAAFLAAYRKTSSIAAAAKAAGIKPAQHYRSVGDLMRYAIINEGLDTLAYFGDFQPGPKPSGFGAEEGTRYSDEQLYALALYIYSLKPPPNPNQFDDRARRGQRIFQQQGCAGCHVLPFYTSNKLTPARGFKVPDDLLKTEDILNASVGTDPTLALQTRRGTGFYKVPSLRGVWYRNAFGHGGQAETLEEWLDPARLKDDYVPKGFHIRPGSIKGHEFGLRLSPGDRQDLITFLKTL